MASRTVINNRRARAMEKLREHLGALAAHYGIPLEFAGGRVKNVDQRQMNDLEGLEKFLSNLRVKEMGYVPPEPGVAPTKQAKEQVPPGGIPTEEELQAERERAAARAAEVNEEEWRKRRGSAQERSETVTTKKKSTTKKK